MKVAIVGYGVEGVASYEYFSKRGDDVTICDQKPDLAVPPGVQAQLGDRYLDNLNQFDLVVRSAGIHPRILLEQNPDIAGKITTQLNEFLRICPTKNVIGITGTKGKGTTSTLTAKMLEAAAKQVFLGGNIGVPLFSFLDQIKPDSWVVLELSSFQLIDLQTSPHIAVCLMVVPEHLDWHADLAEYMGAKSNLFAHQTAEDVAIYFASSENSRQIASAGDGQKLPYFATPGAVVEGGNIIMDGQIICATNELKLVGKHNWQNVCAAVTTVWQVTKDIDAIKTVLTSFSGLPHRIELVRELHGIRFYNDSFSTGLHSTEAAIEAIEGKKVMILGGYDRMLPLEWFGDFVKEKASEFRTLLIIGQSSERLAGALDNAGFANYVIDTSIKDMTGIVNRAIDLAQSGDAIVLSPGFASFDMFKNFEVRGDEFRKTVLAL